MSDKIDISHEVKAICAKLYLEPKNVKRLDIYPAMVTAEVYLLNEHGSKYVDVESGLAAFETKSFSVAA